LVWGINSINNAQITGALDNYRSITAQEVSSSQELKSLQQLIDLPIDQKGKVGVIRDVDSLAKEEDYFKKAKIGDILIIYPNMTIIYDPVNKNVVDIATIKLLK